MIRIVSFSGGKDSTATAILARDAGHEPTRYVFADTGHEHELTLEYVHGYITEALGIEIETVRADFSRQIEGKRLYIENHWERKGVPCEAVERALRVLHPTGVPFLDLCLWKGRFPSRKAQFCTQELKRRPMDALMLDALERDPELESWQGVRRQESTPRAKLSRTERTPEGWMIVRPIIDWSAAQVFDLLKQEGISPNPLYLQGMNRVGCMPCINCRKDELAEIARRYPHHIDRVREWEVLVSEAAKRGWTTFFTDGAHESETDEEIFARLSIDARVEWSKTSRGGGTLDLLKYGEPPACSSAYGLCDNYDYEEERG